jgi:hypothetical protein
MNKFIIASLSAAVASAASTPSFNDATYLAKSRADKSAQIMQQVLADTKPQDWPNTIELAGLLTESMTPTISQVGD